MNGNLHTALAKTFSSSSQHLLVVDGLDDILTASKIQYEALAGLLLEVNRLNLLFQQSGTPAKIILLCRTDLYERLPSANKNKIRQDCAIYLDWYHDTRQPTESSLVKLVNLRAKLSDPLVENIFRQCFPKDFDDKPTLPALLELTRHTPRDFIQLLVNIQKFAEDGLVSRNQILSGIRSYSIEYFVPEIIDEMDGYVSREDIKLAVDLLGSLHKRDFMFADLEVAAKANDRFSKLDLARITDVLFECSAIGSISNRPTGSAYFTFKYRNRNSSLNLNDRLILHRGMWKAMNLI